MSLPRKILLWEDLEIWAANVYGPLVFTNGVFDLLHPGHVHLLTQARDMGAQLLVAMNSDSSTAYLKGPCRLMIPEQERAAMLSALVVVDKIVIIDDLNVTRVLQLARPKIWVKGADYSPETLNADEIAEARRQEIKVELVPLLAEWSTSMLVQRIRART